MGTEKKDGKEKVYQDPQAAPGAVGGGDRSPGSLHEAKEKSRAGRRAAADCDDKPKKKKGQQDSDSEDDFSAGSDDEMFARDEESEEESEEEEGEEKARKPKSLMDQLGVELDVAVNLNTQAKKDNKAVSMKKMGSVAADKPELTRKEREAMEASQKAAAYRAKHAAGETDEAKADLARLKAIRAKREADKAAREAREAEAAEGDKKKEKKEKVDKSAKVVLETPTQKEVKSALTKIKDCANEDWQEKHKLDKLSGNKLAKMKYKDFLVIWEDWIENCSNDEHREYSLS